MYLTVKQQLKHLTNAQYECLRELSRAAKNLYNQGVYNVRQYYFQEGRYLNYEKNYALLKSSENYRVLNSNMAQQILKEADGAFKSFFGLLKLAKKGKYRYQDIRLPKYLPKDGFATLVIQMFVIKDGMFTLPYSQGYKKSHEPVKIKVPPVLSGRKVKEIRIIPKSRAKFFEVQYTYECECIQRDLNKNNALALDFGVDNLVTAASSDGKSFLIDGRRMKSANRLYNKKIARLQGILDKQFPDEYLRSKRMDSITRHRNAYVNDYMSKAAKLVIDYCIKNDIGTLVVGYNVTFQLKSGMGRKNNQNFVMIPYGKLRSKLEYLCELNGIAYIEQEESYTSKASFFDKDEIPVYNDDNPKAYVFSGRRVSRGLYMSSSGYVYNADVNGALNILRKSNVVDLSVLYNRGDVDTPARIRVA
jgi:transposase, IS605 OrfB family, central region